MSEGESGGIEDVVFTCPECGAECSIRDCGDTMRCPTCSASLLAGPR